jgi:S-adenosylmethionine/arginine decarboxylase-like enzyme
MLYHKHILVRLEISSPKALPFMDSLNMWVKNLIKEQGMEIVIGPNSTYVSDPGNEGPTGGCNIKTSHFAYHIWEEKGLIQADLYTCGELDELAFLLAFEVFNPTFGEVMIIDREHGFTIEDQVQGTYEAMIDYFYFDVDLGGN